MVPLRQAGGEIVYRSPAMGEVLSLARRAAAGGAKVLITGESGVGKDLIAREIHRRSPRAPAAFVVVNCAAFTETLLESELFGHVRGSFTDAHRGKPGKLQLAHQGTLFLDEVGEMSVRMQALLLRFLENGEIQPVGAEDVRHAVDVRVVAATNRDLAPLVAAGEFREDLLYRLKVVHIDVPPLRERREDIRPLVEYAASRSGRAIRFTEEALEALERYRWPGNVRQLQNLVEQLVWMAAGEVVGVDELPPPVRAPGGGSVLPVRERRRHVADELYAGLVSGTYTFWEQTYTLFMTRDLTRHDLRELVRRGLAATYGSYRGVVKLFGLDEADYKRFLNFLTTHDCCVDFREYRTGKPHTPPPPETSILPSRIASLPSPSASSRPRKAHRHRPNGQ